MKKKKRYEKAFWLKKKKGNEFNAWKTQGEHTHAANTNMERGD